MSQVMQESGCHGQQAFVAVPVGLVFFIENLGDAPSNLVSSQTMRKTAVLPTVEGIAGSTQLFDAAQPLKFFGID